MQNQFAINQKIYSGKKIYLLNSSKNTEVASKLIGLN